MEKRIYLASSMDGQFRDTITKAAEILRKRFGTNNVYVPMENKIPNAWDYPNAEWGLMVFTEDVCSIDKSDIVVFLNYGRSKTTAGCAWEAGYAYAKGKAVIVVDIDLDSVNEKFITSLMIENGRYATLQGLEGLAQYNWENMDKPRTKHEQK